MHRVFPSSCNIVASSRKFQFRRASIGDSRAVVTPFMQDGTYPPRNFATLGPLWLQPPFTGTYKNCYYNFISFYSTGQVSDFIIQFFSKSCVFKKQSLPSFYFTIGGLYPEVTNLFCRVPSISL